MATATFGGASWDNNNVFINGVYDTTSLVLTTIDYQNLSNGNAQITILGPSNFKKTYTLAANTARTSLDISADNFVLVRTTGVDRHGNAVSFVNLPAGWSTSFNWPI